MSSTEGSGGGEPLRLSKEPVERPVIPRGSITIERRGEKAAIGEPFTFEMVNGGFRLTYHNITAEIVRPLYVEVYVSEMDVVTWEKLDAQ